MSIYFANQIRPNIFVQYAHFKLHVNEHYFK